MLKSVLIALEDIGGLYMKKYLSLFMALIMVFQCLPVGSVTEGFFSVQSNALRNSDAGSLVTVRFLDKDEDTTLKALIVAKGESIPQGEFPAAPDADEGYVFDGWYSGDTRFVADDTKVNDNIQLTPRYVKDSETWEIVFYNRDGQIHKKVYVVKGKTIGEELPDPISREGYNAFWAVGMLTAGDQGSIPTKTGDRIDHDFMPEDHYHDPDSMVIVPDYDQITYTVSFYQEDQTTLVGSRTVNFNTNYCLNEIPTVPAKDGYIGKWVYQDGEDVRDFNNSVEIKADTRVWAKYTQNVFTVTYMVGEETYETDTYFEGDSLNLPASPAVEGKDFVGWFIGETQYHGGGCSFGPDDSGATDGQE